MKRAFVFPGQGSQYVGMGKDIYENFPVARETFAEASDALGFDIAQVSFYGPVGELNKTFRTQPCILTVSIALHRVLREKDIEPAVVAGHSLGEYSALVAAGVLSLRDAVKVTEKRGLFMQEAVPEGKGLMAAILGLERKKVEDICMSLRLGYAAPANYNCPGQIVVAGEKHAVEEAVERSRNAGAKRAVPLDVSAPSHCRLMDSASKKLSDLLDTLSFNNAIVPVVNNADAVFLTDVTRIKESLVRQLNCPILWEDSVRAIIDSGVTTFLEVGPGKVLSGLIRRIDPSATAFSIGDMGSLEKTLSAIKDNP
ncbi:MAG TPA: ACP S-malonyltransferase [Thermodesulfovibrionales bacterium]|jgi:[acyl-carrier-protein] S-malonyltransferase|nr:ACP S-malonyltransferase [Thermodesulfovibrionales bacterium]